MHTLLHTVFGYVGCNDLVQDVFTNREPKPNDLFLLLGEEESNDLFLPLGEEECHSLPLG